MDAAKHALAAGSSRKAKNIAKYVLEKVAVAVMADASCSSCRFFKRNDDLEDGYGECHRLPPAVLSIEPGVHDVAWPTVALADWCGEWRGVREEPR